MKEITTDKTILNENSDILKTLFKELNNYPIYSKEDQIKFAKEAKSGNKESRNKLITSNLKFVITCAKKYIGLGVPLIDLVQGGMVGLCIAVDKYDPDRGYSFITFAVWYIRREILREIYNNGRTIRYPITYISNITKVKKAYEKFVSENQKEPTDEELIKIANVTQKQYDSVVMDKSYCQSLDTPLTEDNSTTIGDTLTEEPSLFTDTFTKETISKVLKCLNNREYKVITEFYGLNGEYEHSIKEIALEMGLGDERIRQIRKGAIKKLEKRYGKTLKTLL